MVKRSRGSRRSTRKLLKQKPGYRPAITKFLQEFNVNQKVVIDPETSSQKGMPFPRFKGKVGKVVGRRGGSYIVEIEEGTTTKKVIARPEHLKAV